jgi:hypothetical protein
MRVLAFGSRTYTNQTNINSALNTIHAATPAEILITGCSNRTVDIYARTWAKSKGVPIIDLDDYISGSSGSYGPQHNAALLLKGYPGSVVVFGDPTKDGEVADMIKRCQDQKLTLTQQVS